jgi:mono/diheme cytochrome c family protein
MWKSKRKIIAHSCLLIAAIFASHANAADPLLTSAADQQRILDGKYISTAADCVACHTAKGGAPYAGGYPIESPMGTIWSTNITPSKQFGIGSYTREEFTRALREGVAKDGRHLYPAMPYTSYGKMTDEDIGALYDYFMNDVKPVDTAPAQQTELPFPFNVRASMAGWNAIYSNPAPFKADPEKSELINRGDYLVNALAHCAECHTPRTLLMGEDKSKPLAGASMGAWFAPNITSDKAAGIGGWTDEEIFAYLRTGHVAGKAQAAGPMAEAVENSLQHLTDGDLKAIVAYLRQTLPIAAGDTQPRYGFGQAAATETALRGNAVLNVDPGWKVYSATCAACHGAKGDGTKEYPSLFHNTTTGAATPDNLIATVLYGVHRKIEGSKDVEMPGFGPQAAYTERLTDQQIADVTNYVLTHFGQPQQKVTAQHVELARHGGPEATLPKLARIGLPVAAVVLVLIVIAILATRRRRSNIKGMR